MLAGAQENSPSLSNSENENNISPIAFSPTKMSEKCKTLIFDAKLKERPYLQLADWGKSEFYKSDEIKQLFTCSENIQRRDCESLTLETFMEYYEKGNQPLIIQNIVKKYFKEAEWSFEKILSKYKNDSFKIAEDADGKRIKIPLKYFMEYMFHQKDDNPLYLFGSVYHNSKKQKQASFLNEFEIPPFFKDDLLSLIEEKKRPPFRWFLLGPKRSGSKIHIDPFKTSAWNTLFVGHKRWVMFPEKYSKYLVNGKEFIQKDEESEALNYFLYVLPKIKQNLKEPQDVIEFIQKPGDTVFIPGGWWHAVINLEDSLAFTQNFMSHCSLEKIWRCLRKERIDLATLFLKSAKEKEKEIYEKIVALNKRDDFYMKEQEDEEKLSNKTQEIIVVNNESLELLNQISEIERERNFSNSSLDNSFNSDSD